MGWAYGSAQSAWVGRVATIERAPERPVRVPLYQACDHRASYAESQGECRTCFSNQLRLWPVLRRFLSVSDCGASRLAGVTTKPRSCRSGVRRSGQDAGHDAPILIAALQAVAPPRSDSGSGLCGSALYLKDSFSGFNPAMAPMLGSI